MATTVSDKLKLYVFPGLASLLGLLIWTTVNDIKSDLAAVREDIRVLMAQSNIDKTRIDNLERSVFTRKSAGFPVKVPELPSFMLVEAIKPEEQIDLTKKI